MRYLSMLGRIFNGIAIAVMGLLTVYYRDFPYMLLPASPHWIGGVVILVYISGVLLIMSGACIILKKVARSISIVLGTVLLLIFCFCFIPYQFMVSPNYLQFGDWENAAKELALCGGAFVIAGSFPGKNENSLTRFLSKLISFGSILFPITIISFGTDHFIFAQEAADYVPSWVPFHLFWMYFTGTALIGAGLAVSLKIKTQLVAILLGTMIFSWFIILHIPRVIASPVADIGSEIASAFIALAYSGTAFAIAGNSIFCRRNSIQL